jgi:alkanesulfonate monooxygenase SsuD/methylene tetrahydromethanopterin reductase-like flavin-dependent oxidoreductase (luciferase family)
MFPFEIWQAVTSPPTVEYVPVVDHGAVFWNQHPNFVKRMWDRYGELHEQHHHRNLARGAQRMVVVTVRVEDTHEAAMKSARNGHDEFWKFLGPYGWSRGYMGEDGKPVKPGLIPSLEESMKQRTILVGSPAEVAEHVQYFRDELGVEDLTIFPHLVGDPYTKAIEQMDRFRNEVLPLVS